MGSAKVIKKRNEIDDKYKWAITDLYADDTEWQKEYDQVLELGTVLSEYEGTLAESADRFYEFLMKSDQMNKLLERVYVYANQRYHEDTSNAAYQKLSDMASNLMVNVSSKISFATSEILDVDEKIIEQFYKDESALLAYKRFIDNLLRKKPHVLSKAEEKLLAEMGEVADASSNIFSMFNNADLKFGKVKNEEGEEVDLTHARYSLFLQSKDRNVRKEAFDAMYTAYENFRNTLAATFSANIKQEVFYAKARKYDSSLKMQLDDGNIDVSVYTNLLEVVHENLPLLHRYIELRKKVLSLDEIHMYDLYVPMVSDVDMKIPFEEAKTIVSEGLKPLGDEYAAILKEGYDNSWIDVYENEGKRSGAYSWGAYGTHPYVLLNYQDNLNNVFTLAHEMGHAIHSYYSDETQPYIYAGYKIFVAEVASTCNEALLMHHLLKTTTDKKKRAYLINYQLEQFRTTLYRQAMFAEFEMITHGKVEANEPLTADSLCQIYHDLNQKYFGEDAVIDSHIDMEWARIPHFYNAFYVYQYATGYSAAIALSQRILNEGEAAVIDYINFLRGGSSKDPIDLLKGAGVDMTTKKPVTEALLVFKSLLDEFEALI
ncbi:MAG: oligoendopeptidase F [bacterium]|nr:oligoendopeptidase F [bacterium]